MHQDASWWQGFPIEGLLSVMVAIDGATTANGGLELFPGSAVCPARPELNKLGKRS